MSRHEPYVTVEARAALDHRWTADLWFAWSRILSTCRLKRACTPESWPAAVLRVRTIEAASILSCHPNKVRWMLDRLTIAASIEVRSNADRHGYVWTISVSNYAKYQKLGRPTYDISREPPYVPTSLRKKKNPPVSPRKRGEQRGLTDAPERLSDEQRAALHAWCAGKRQELLPQLEDLEEACLDYYRSRGKRHRDWVATVRNWIRKETPRARSPDARAAQLADIARQATALREQRERHRAEDRRADPHVRRLRPDADPEPPRDVPRDDRPLLTIAARGGDS